ncbi:2-keto-4-pentenoate hydratase [Paracoccus aerius]|uniref:Fumarylacetoacetate hydrolase family protein n=1 Tax=Paracoccus aerius TaxID=1915382 RepID=A0ABS1S759_9RHOB|nr:fumarylacetoacetate hydrolase family protein [Paracoccus aerius]MBL3673929.1 fumarylacetoacetate hydrolase family protein [Paracoccus aerius]GHG27656.1 2-hydroxypenta-2,4-dienoate hydratase [Paracoccus aerius]
MTQTQTRSMPDDALSAEIIRSLAEGRQIPCLTTRDGGLSLSRAYRIGALIEAARVGQGSQVVGRKIGFTNKTIWDEFNVSAPIFGPMYDSTVRPLGVPFPLTGLMEPRIEPEIAFRLAAAPGPGMAPDALITCIGGICAGFEMVHSIFPGWRFEAADTVAGFGLHGAFLHGPIRDLDPSERFDWVERLRDFETTLSRDGVVLDRGHARNVLGGGPLVALGHLADLLATMPDAAPLMPGDIVTTGTLTQALPVRAGETWQADFDRLPLDSIRIDLI